MGTARHVMLHPHSHAICMTPRSSPFHRYSPPSSTHHPSSREPSPSSAPTSSDISRRNEPTFEHSPVRKDVVKSSSRTFTTAAIALFPFRRRRRRDAHPVTNERFESEDDPVSTSAVAVEYVRHGTREFFINRPSTASATNSGHNTIINPPTPVRGGARYVPGDKLTVRETMERRTIRGRLLDRAKRLAFPVGYPHSVGPGFVEYTRWRMSAFFFGGAIGVFSTQGLLLAVGVGRQSAAPLAAALQWVIRDGLGRAGRMLFSQVGNGFDAETKQYRLMAAFVLNMSCALESLTPAVPSLFLPLACIANMAKGASTVAAASTRGAIYKSFMRAENLGDITAKQETVGVMGDLTGTAMGILLSRATAGNPNLSAAAFTAVSCAHLFSVYREIKGIQLRTLNRQRAHMLIKYYLEAGKVPNLRDGNRNERIVNRPWLDSLHAPNIDLGARLQECAPDAEALQYLLRMYRKERYLFSYEDTRMKIVLHKDAKSYDCLKAFLQADYFWNRYKEEGVRESRNRQLLEESYRFANSRFDSFVKEAKHNGWVTGSVHLRPIGRRASWNNS